MFWYAYICYEICYELILNVFRFSQVSVGAHIHPQKPVIHTGNMLNFSVTGKMSNQIGMKNTIIMPVLLNRHLQCDLGADHQVSGQWVSSNRSVLSVNAVSGQAKAISQGSAHGNTSFHAFSVVSWISREHYHYEMFFLLHLRSYF